MARLKREWAESASASASSDDTVKVALEKSPPSTHLNIFFPRLRKVTKSSSVTSKVVLVTWIRRLGLR